MIESKKEIVYAAFIITYNRPGIIGDTIEKISKQSIAPQKILIIDNSDNYDTRNIVENLNNSLLEYHYVGYNSGPSGGAYIGLKMLAQNDYDWHFWVDDDNPPEDIETIEKIFDILPFVNQEECGQLGLVGHRFNKWTGEIIRIDDKELNKNVIEVDTIGGGQCKIISSKVSVKEIFPNKNLFFGFEDLDIDIKIKKAGYKSYISGKLLYQERKKNNRLNFERKGLLTHNDFTLNREYYSVRSLLTIFSENLYLTALLYLSFKKLVSSVFIFKQGVIIGFKHIKIVYLAYYHFFIKKYGKIDLKL